MDSIAPAVLPPIAGVLFCTDGVVTSETLCCTRDVWLREELESYTESTEEEAQRTAGKGMARGDSVAWRANLVWEIFNE